MDRRLTDVTCHRLKKDIKRRNREGPSAISTKFAFKTDINKFSFKMRETCLK